MCLHVDSGHIGAKKQSRPGSLVLLVFVNIQVDFSPLYFSIMIVRKKICPGRTHHTERKCKHTRELGGFASCLAQC